VVTFDFYLNEKHLGGADTPVANFPLKLCASTDLTCAAPLDSEITDANGKVTFSVDVGSGSAGIDGYIQAIDSSTIYYPSLIYPGNHRIIGNPTVGTYNAAVFSKSLIATGMTLAGVTPDAARGHIVEVNLDCDYNPAAGVSVQASTADASSKTMYVSGALISKTATQTDVSGAAFVFNVPPGASTLTSSTASVGTLGTVDVSVRAATMTITFYSPYPIP
jgi:hypothetical protein